MKYTEMRITPDAAVWGAPEAFLTFLRELLEAHGPVLIIIDPDAEGYIQKVDTDDNEG
jgi:hypothetical protein